MLLTKNLYRIRIIIFRAIADRLRERSASTPPPPGTDGPSARVDMRFASEATVCRNSATSITHAWRPTGHLLIRGECSWIGLCYSAEGGIKHHPREGGENNEKDREAHSRHKHSTRDVTIINKIVNTNCPTGHVGMWYFLVAKEKNNTKRGAIFKTGFIFRFRLRFQKKY